MRGKALAGVMVRGILLADVVRRRIRSVSRGPTRPGSFFFEMRRFSHAILPGPVRLICAAASVGVLLGRVPFPLKCGDLLRLAYHAHRMRSSRMPPLASINIVYA